MHADDREVIPLILFVPFPDPGNHSLAVNSAESPELQQYDLAAQIFQRQRGVRVDPDLVVPRRRGAITGKGSAVGTPVGDRRVCGSCGLESPAVCSRSLVRRPDFSHQGLLVILPAAFVLRLAGTAVSCPLSRGTGRHNKCRDQYRQEMMKFFQQPIHGNLVYRNRRVTRLQNNYKNQQPGIIKSRLRRNQYSYPGNLLFTCA